MRGSQVAALGWQIPGGWLADNGANGRQEGQISLTLAFRDHLVLITISLGQFKGF